MNTIHRFSVPKLVGISSFQMSPEHRLLGVTPHAQDGITTLYAVVNPDVDKTATVSIRGIMTGEDFDVEADNIGAFLGTINLPTGFVIHYFHVTI